MVNETNSQFLKRRSFEPKHRLEVPIGLYQVLRNGYDQKIDSLLVFSCLPDTVDPRGVKGK